MSYRGLAAATAQSSESFQYDQDGNLVRGGRWVYGWSAENRLIEMYTRTDIATAVPRQRLTFTYDYRGRRVAKRVYSQTEPDIWTLTDERQFVYDGWQLIREVASADVSGTRSYFWGLDLSGSLQGAGGVGGLLAIIDQGAGEAGIRIPAYDANGNITELTRLTDAAIEAVYEYDPFGNTLRQTGPYASANPYRFSTKYTDDETGLVYYGYRYYSPLLGRWLNRDPVGEEGGENLYGFLSNDPLNASDQLGLRNLPKPIGPSDLVIPDRAGGPRIYCWCDKAGTAPCKCTLGIYTKTCFSRCYSQRCRIRSFLWWFWQTCEPPIQARLDQREVGRYDGCPDPSPEYHLDP